MYKKQYQYGGNGFIDMALAKSIAKTVLPAVRNAAKNVLSKQVEKQGHKLVEKYLSKNQRKLLNNQSQKIISQLSKPSANLPDNPLSKQTKQILSNLIMGNGIVLD